MDEYNAITDHSTKAKSMEEFTLNERYLVSEHVLNVSFKLMASMMSII